MLQEQLEAAGWNAEAGHNKASRVMAQALVP